MSCVRGTVLVVLADTLAAHQLGGFKIGVGFSLRKCRQCMATLDDMQTQVCIIVAHSATLLLLCQPLLLCLQFTEEGLHLRNPTNYDYHCSLLSGPLGTADSVTYGLNYCSPLNKINGFHAASGQMPQDIMHVLFEGVLHKEIRLMLKCFIYDEHYFSLDTFNTRIENFAYGRKESRSKPPKAFLHSHINGNSKLPLSGDALLMIRTMYFYAHL